MIKWQNFAKKISFNQKKLQKKQKKILILGVSFKENVNDIRNSKAFEIIDVFKKKTLKWI